MKTLATILSALALTSCITIVGTTKFSEAPVEERTLTINTDVTAIAASSDAEIIVDATLPANEIRVKTHTDIFDILEITSDNQTLEVGLREHTLRAKTFEVRIPILAYNSIAASGGADIEWHDCRAEMLTIAASGGADVAVHPTKSLTVNASGGADVSYCGNPESKDISRSGGADVYRAD